MDEAGIGFYSPEDRAAIRRVYDYVSFWIQANLTLSEGSSTIGIRYESFGPDSNALASTITDFILVSYANLRTRYLAQEDTTSEPRLESALYENFPPLMRFYAGQDVTKRTCDNVLVPRALAVHLGLGQIPPGLDGRIAVNIDRVFDFRPRDKDRTGADFAEVLTHETLHPLGFSSSAEAAAADVTENRMRVQDLFRMEDTGASQLIGFQFFNALRELRPSREAITVTYLGSGVGSLQPLSRGDSPGGDGYQASHWRFRGRLTPPVPIGVMDPASGSSRLFEAPFDVSQYYTLADMRALDIMGWDIDHTLVPRAASEIVVTQPLPGETVSSLTPRLEWQAADGSSHYHVFVYEVIGSTRNLVFSAEDLMNTYVDLESDALTSGRTYEWFVTAESLAGFTYGASLLFHTEATCPADWNGDNVVNSNDTNSFLTAWLDSVNNMNLIADFNGDLMVNSNDISSFLTAWLDAVQNGC